MQQRDNKIKDGIQLGRRLGWRGCDLCLSHPLQWYSSSVPAFVPERLQSSHVKQKFYMWTGLFVSESLEVVRLLVGYLLYIPVQMHCIDWCIIYFVLVIFHRNGQVCLQHIGLCPVYHLFTMMYLFIGQGHATSVAKEIRLLKHQ